MIERIRKREGRVVEFQTEKIALAISKAFRAVGREEEDAPFRLAERVAKEAEERFSRTIPGVEEIQDLVERALISAGYADVAKAYILYRQKKNGDQRSQTLSRSGR